MFTWEKFFFFFLLTSVNHDGYIKVSLPGADVSMFTCVLRVTYLCLRACFDAILISKSNLSEGGDRDCGQMRGDKVYLFNGITSYS